MNNDRYLPVGSIIKLKDVNSKLMIMGYCVFVKDDKNKIKDYVACIYPEGVKNLTDLFSFKHEEISEVLYRGYEDEISDKFNDVLKLIVIGKDLQANE